MILIHKRKNKDGETYTLMGSLMIDGKRVKKTFGYTTSNLEEAKKYKEEIAKVLNKEDNLDSIIEKGKKVLENTFYVGKGIMSNISFKEYSNNIIENRYNVGEISYPTYRKYKQSISRISYYMGEIEVRNLKTRDINNYIVSVKDKISSSTLDTDLSVIKLVTKYAISEEMLDKDITKGILKPRKTKTEKYVYNEDEIKDLLDCVEKEEDKALALQIKLALKLGLRNSEVLGLCWDCIDFDKEIIQIKRITSIDEQGNKVLVDRVKTKSSERCLKIPKSLLNDLKEYKLMTYKECVNEMLFTKNEKPLDKSDFGANFEKFLRKNDLPRITVHTLRHIYGSLMVKSGRNILEVSKSMGHSNPNITANVYLHELENRMEKKDASYIDTIFDNIG